MTILYAYLIAGALFVVGTMRIRLRALILRALKAEKARHNVPAQSETKAKLVYAAGSLIGFAIAVVVWPILVVDMWMSADSYEEGDDA